MEIKNMGMRISPPSMDSASLKRLAQECIRAWGIDGALRRTDGDPVHRVIADIKSNKGIEL